MNKLRRVEISFDGLNVEKAVNYLLRENIMVYYVKRLPDRRCVIAVPTHKSREVVDLLEQRCYNNIQCKLRGLDGWLDRCRRHIALVLILTMILPMLLVMSNVCSDIRLDTTLDSQQVVDALKEQGVYKGAWLNSVNFDQVENAIAKQFDSMYAVITRQGNVVYVKIINRDTGLPNINYNERYDIVANSDGVISRMTVVQGTALVKVGDTVKKGQVLIEGIRHFQDGTFEEVRALGEVYATVSAVGYEQYTGTVINLVDSGQTYQYVTVKLGQVTSYNRPIKYDNYRIEQSSVTLYPLCIDVIYNIVYEQIQVVEQVSFASDSQRLTELARAKAQQSVSWQSTNEQVELIDGVGVRVTLIGEICITDSLVTGGTEQ